MKLAQVLLLVLATLLALPVAAQGKPAADKPADNMQILRERLMADKKAVVAAAMELTQAEAKAFWPLYEEFQKELYRINDRTAIVIVNYAKEYNAGKLTDARAMKLLDEALAVEEAGTKLKRSFVPKLSKVLPGIKVARYLQIENKVRAIVNYEIAGEVPLAK